MDAYAPPGYPVVIEALIGVGCRVLSVALSMVDEVRALDARACAAVAASILGVSLSRAV